MQAKISAGNDCLWFLQVTGGNFPAPAGKLGEALFVPVRSAFFKGKRERDVSFYPVPNTLTKVTTCCFWSQWWTLQIWFCFKRVGLFLAGSSNRYPKKQLAKKVPTTIKMIGNWLLSLFRFPHSYRVKERKPAKVGVGLKNHLKHSAFSMNITTFCSRKHRIRSKTKNALLFLGEYFPKNSKIQFPREGKNKYYWSISAEVC